MPPAAIVATLRHFGWPRFRGPAPVAAGAPVRRGGDDESPQNSPPGPADRGRGSSFHFRGGDAVGSPADGGRRLLHLRYRLSEPLPRGGADHHGTSGWHGPGRPARFVARRFGPLDVRGRCRQGCRGRNHRALPRLGDRGQREPGRGADDGGPGRRVRGVRGPRLAPRAAGIGRGLRDRGLRRAGRPRGSRQRQRRLRFTNSTECDGRGC